MQARGPGCASVVLGSAVGHDAAESSGQVRDVRPFADEETAATVSEWTLIESASC